MLKKLFSILMVMVFIIASIGSSVSSAIGSTVSTLASNCGGMPTFGSFNQHMVEIDGVYYASLLDNGYIRIMKSTDKGATWTNFYGPGQHTGVQPACLVVDNYKQLFAAWDDNGVGRMMRWSGSPLSLDVDTTTGDCSTKFSFVYSQYNNYFFWSRRDNNGDLYVVKLNNNCQVVSSARIANHVGTWGQNNAYWDAHYHSLNVDQNGRIHLIYNPHYWPNATDANTFDRKKVLYMYSDDIGATWKKANGTAIGLPFWVNDFTNGGTVISTEDNAYVSSALGTSQDTHILYWTNIDTYKNSYNVMYVRLNRSTGNEEKRCMIPGLNAHSTLVRDKYTKNLYILTEVADRISLLQSNDNGDNWKLVSQNYRLPANSYYYSATASQQVTGDGAVIGMTTDWVSAADAIYTGYNVRGNTYCRMEATASGSTQVTDGASLRLDGTSQVRNYLGSFNGNPVSLNGTNFGTYENTDGLITPVPFMQIKGAANNNFFGKLNNSNNEGVELGDLRVGSGLTLEGWFYPTGNQADAYNNTRLITKRTTWRSGNYWLCLTSNGQVQFGIYGNTTYKVWNSSNNSIQWNKWNYIAVTWNRDANTVDFYLKQTDSALNHEAVTDNTNAGSFPNVNDTVTIGYSSGWGKGFQGCFDEIRISDYKLDLNELFVEDGQYYRFEATNIADTPVTDGASLRLDGTSRVRDENGSVAGNPVSLNGTSFGTYESAVGSVIPVPKIQIRGAADNRFFGKTSNSNNEGINLGDLRAGSGLSLEGWFYPTGLQSDAYNNTRLITKRTTWNPGNYWMCFTSNGQLEFGVYCNNTYKSWVTSNNRIQWNQWNYAAVTWNRNSNDVDFYIKQIDGSIIHETVTNSTSAGTFPDSNDNVSIGYSSGWGKGFEGYFDEVRISDFKRTQDSLLVVNASNNNYYRFENTASGSTQVSDGTSLRLDGTYQVKDYAGNLHGNPYSTYNGVTYGTYESSDGGVTPVSFTQIRGAASNGYFAKLNKANKERIDIGDIDVYSGLTLEGWFYPNFSSAEAGTKGRLLTKLGGFWLQINTSGGVDFGIGDDLNVRQWSSSNSLVGFQKWNYIAVTWQKGSTNATFYVKQIDGALTTETKTNNSVQSGYPQCDSSVLIGQAPFYDIGFNGYLDEIRLSDYARTRNSLLLP